MSEPDSRQTGRSTAPDHAHLLTTLERLLSIQAMQLEPALDEATQVLSDAFNAQKVDTWMREPSPEVLTVRGNNDSPMSRRERELGLDQMPLVNGGRVAEVYLTGKPYLTGRADEDAGVLPGFTQGLGVRSMMAVPLEMSTERRGVLLVSDSRSDIFDERSLELLAAAGRWVGLVAERAELAERIAAQVAADARRTVAEELVTVLAHDLRNHLAPMRTRLQLMERRAAREDRGKDLQDTRSVLGSLDRMGRLVNDLLDVGRLDQGMLHLASQPVELCGLAQETAERFQGGTVQIVVRSTMEEVYVLADPDRVRQVLENLIANAVKHSPPNGTVTMAMSARKVDGRAMGVITVADEGPGIPGELVPRLFSRFAAGPGSSGMGLGLYLAREIAQAHGGALVLEPSTVGARFELRLPLED